jgi:hypothetical protein
MFTLTEVYEEMIRDAIEQYNSETKYIVISGGDVYHVSGEPLLAQIVDLLINRKKQIFISKL